MRYRARRPAAHRPVAVGRVDVGIGQNAARLTAVFGRNYRLNNMYFIPSERPVAPSSSPVTGGVCYNLGGAYADGALGRLVPNQNRRSKTAKIAYFTPPGQNFLRLRRAYKALRVGGTAGPGPPPCQSPPSGPTRWSIPRGRASFVKLHTRARWSRRSKPGEVTPTQR